MSKSFNIVLFEDYTPMDVFGPVEVISKVPDTIKINFYSENGGTVRGAGNTQVETLPFFALNNSAVLVVPGGFGTRKEVNNVSLIQKIREMSMVSEYVLTICTGAALLAKTGLLDGRSATSNKLAFDWVQEQGEQVRWVRNARWVRDGKYYTSSGVAAGIDMALGFIEDRYGRETAENIALRMEYVWNSDKDLDLFSPKSLNYI